jgi:hypothetical protein
LTAKFLLLTLKIVVESSGTAAATAVRFHKLAEDVRSAVGILSGGDVKFEELAGY